jgi:D-xylose transport system ATP-binding protein
LGSKLVILDEPTAALGVQQTAQVLELVRRLASQGQAILLISHSLPDVFAVADRICVLRLGANAGMFVRRDTDVDEVVSAMTGGLTLAGGR